MAHILLTGFDPFGGDTVNASAEAVRRVEAAWTGPHTLSTAILPVAFGRSAAELGALVDRIRPDIVIAVGEAAGRNAITPERTAFDEAAPQTRATMLDVDSLIAACRAVGVACEASDSAGRFVCNEVFYRLVEKLDGRSDVIGGFIHVPAVRGREGEHTVDALATGLAAMARDAAGRVRDSRCVVSARSRARVCHEQ